MSLTETPMQAERARTIYEKSKPGRRAAVLCRTAVCRSCPLEELIPAHLLREEPPWLPGDRRAGDRPPLQQALAP